MKAIEDPEDYNHYRIGFCSISNDFDTVFTLLGTKQGFFTHNSPGNFFPVSVASVDENGIENIFSGEILPDPLGVDDPTVEERMKSVELIQNRPNPFDESTIISFYVKENLDYDDTYLMIHDMERKEIQRTNLNIKQGVNEVLYSHGYNKVGTFVYSLIIDGQVIDSKKMVFAN